MSIRLVQVIAIACCLLVACQTRTVTSGPTPTPGAAPPTAVSPKPTTAATRPAASAGSTPPSGSPATATTPNSNPAGSPAATNPPQATSAPSPVACHYGPTERIAQAQDRGIKEASALVASLRWPGIYWTVNDSGNAPSVYAVDEQGRARGTFRVDDGENDDWETMQAGPGRDGGTALYIGDIGDNDGKRRELTIYRVPEPEPSPAGSKPANGRTASAEAFKVSYPAGARDAEALMVHPQTGEILIVTKETAGRALVFRVPLPLDARHTARLEQVASLDLRAIGGGLDLVVDAAVSPDGRRATIRTYGRALEYDVPAGAPLASIWGQTPRVTIMNDGPQGESITYRADGSALVSISEGSPAPIFLSAWTC